MMMKIVIVLSTIVLRMKGWYKFYLYYYYTIEIEIVNMLLIYLEINISMVLEAWLMSCYKLWINKNRKVHLFTRQVNFINAVQLSVLLGRSK